MKTRLAGALSLSIRVGGSARYVARRVSTGTHSAHETARHEIRRAHKRMRSGDDPLGVVYDLLDVTLFSWLVAYVKHPLHICALLVLWATMLVSSGNVALELLIGNYTNGLSAVAGSILLLRQMHHHVHVRKSLDDLHAKVDAISAQNKEG